MKPHSAKIVRGNIYTARTQDEFGRDAYYIVQVSSTSERAFLKTMQGTAMVDYRQFGNLLASGFGHNPDEATRARLKAEHDYEVPE